MIFELKIKDFILITSETITFKDGLNIITGETGAGKSMILGAIDLVLGATASKEAIRVGAESALVQCSFYATNEANGVLKAAGIEVDEDIIIISREINVKGKSVSRVNGQTVTLNVIKDVTQYLMDIHGQFDNQVLFNKAYQLGLVDNFGGKPLLEKRDALTDLYEALHSELEKKAQLELDKDDRERQVDFLSFQFDEIEQIAPKINEDEEIESAFNYHANLGKIGEAFQFAKEAFDGDSGEGVLSMLSKLASALKKVERYDHRAEVFSKRLEDQYYLIEDLARDMRTYSEQLNQDPEKFYQLETRLNDLNKLKSKYGKTIESILEYKADISQKLERFESIETELLECEKKIQMLSDSYDVIADEITSMRKIAADSFVKMATKELSSLNMQAASLSYTMDKLDRRGALGHDDFELLISTNVGQPVKALKKVLSGGELSRLMLAIKIITGNSDGEVAQIFDEIDAGISGITANVVGEKLHQLAMNHQIICITHLPQIAVFADHHFMIHKVQHDTYVETKVEKIEQEEIINEIARLVGGAERTDKTMAHANEMLRLASQRKSEQ